MIAATRVLVLCLIATLLAIVTWSEATSPKQDVICARAIAISPYADTPRSAVTGETCLVPHESNKVLLVRVDDAILNARVGFSDSARAVPVAANLDPAEKTILMESRPDRISAILVPHDAREGSAPALAVIGRPSFSLDSPGLGALTLWGSSSTLTIEWKAHQPCPLAIDGYPTGMPSVAHWGPGDSPTYTFSGTEEGCPAGSLTFENLGGWTVA